MEPALKWDHQFTAVVNKIKEAIGRLKNAAIMISTASMHYNMHLSKKEYFRSGIFSLNSKQENILKKTCEPVILRKMGLSKKFLD